MRKVTKRIIFGGIVILAGAVLFWQLRMSPAAHQSEYEEIKVQRSSITLTVVATGSCAPEHRLEIKSPIAGRAESVEVRMGDSVKQGQVLAWMSSSERAALLDAARSKGPKEYKFWQGVYRPTPLLAPLAGVIISGSLVPGQVVETSDTLLVMSDRLIVEVDMDETDLAQVKLGQKVSLTLDSYPNVEIPGKVYQIAYAATTINNVTTYKVDVLPDKVPDFMRSGMTANAVFEVNHASDVLTLPSDAIVDGHFALTPVSTPPHGAPSMGEQSALPERRPVQTGLTDGKLIEIRSGLSEGESVLRPVYQLPSEADGSMNILPRPKAGQTSAP